jgi:hypothetical protein
MSHVFISLNGLQNLLQAETRPALKNSCKVEKECLRWRAVYASFIASHLKGMSHMELSASLLRQLDNPNLSHDQRAELRCQLAKGYEDVGQLEAARQAMGELWQRIGERPKIEGLEKSTAAEVLLRVGVLTSWIGSCNQIPDAQETAKNLISESITIFESLDYGKKILEGQSELAVCYWREGRYDEAHRDCGV